MKKSSVIGACVMTAAVVLSVPLGVHTSLTSLGEEGQLIVLLRQDRLCHLGGH